MRWTRYFERQRRDADLSVEIAHHIAQEIDDNVARGLSPEDARAAALRKFGNRRAKYYRLTPAGRAYLTNERSRWEQLVRAVGRVLGPATE